MADAAEYQARLRHSLLDLARRLQSGGNADTVDFVIFRLQQINRHLVQSDRFNEVVHCLSDVTILLESVKEFGTNHGPHATSVPSGAAGRPKFDIPQEQLQYLIDYEISMTKIAQALGVLKNTIKRPVREYGISVWTKPWPSCNLCAERCRRKTEIRYSTRAAAISDRL